MKCTTIIGLPVTLFVVILPLLPYQKISKEGSAVEFVDVADQAKIRFTHSTGNELAEIYVLEGLSSGGGFLDYNNDGFLDIYLVNGAPLPGGFKKRPRLHNVLYRNNKDGTFTDVTKEARVDGHGYYGMGVAVGDFDNDGDSDIYVTNFGPNILYRNNGDGTFTDITKIAGVGDRRWGASAAFFDYDNDGDLDLFVVNYLQYTLEGAQRDPWLTQGGVGYYRGTANILYRNNGNGTFTDVSKRAGIANPEGKGLGVVCADFDNDGWMDIYVANDTVRNFLYHNNGDGTFTDIGLQAGIAYSVDGKEKAGMGVDAGDYDNDGWLDVTVTNFAEETNTLWHNNRDGTFTDVTEPLGVASETYLPMGFGIKFFDYDNDGDEDLIVANGHLLPGITWIKSYLAYRQNKLLLENLDGREFINVSTKHGEIFSQPQVGRGLAVGDFDNDGDLDVLITNANDRPNLLRNDGGNKNNWLVIKPIGIRSNRDGIGVRATIKIGDLTRVKQICGGGSYLSAHEYKLHFGLGKATQVDLLELRWPSGLVQRLDNIPANQTLTLTEIPVKGSTKLPSGRTVRALLPTGLFSPNLHK